MSYPPIQGVTGYFLTVTPPLPQSEQESARLLGKER